MFFRLFIEVEVVDKLLVFPNARRRRFLTFFRRIQEFPANSSELVERDNDGKILDVCTFEGMEIRYWIDHADRHVKIVRLTEND